MRRPQRKNFALIGAAGYVAPKHCHAIHGVNGDLLVALDPADSVGMLDQYFQIRISLREALIATYKLVRNGVAIGALTVCSLTTCMISYSVYFESVSTSYAKSLSFLILESGCYRKPAGRNGT